MGSFLDGLGTLVGGAGNAGAASNNAWNYGQYSPYTVNNPMGQIGYNGTTANQSLSPMQAGMQNTLGGVFNQASQGVGYNPNTSFLPQQYQSIYGNMQGNANSMFNSLQTAQQPYVNQMLQSNMDNQQAKGTLASTAGSYQTMGANQAAYNQMNTNQATAQNYALQNAQAQMAGATQTAGLGEQQAEFGPQMNNQLMQGALSGTLNQNSQLNQMLQLSGNMGAQRSGANVSAAMPGIGTGAMQDQASAGLLSGLLFGGGTSGGLLSALLGGGSGGGLSNGLGSIGGSIASLFGGSSGGSGSGPGGIGLTGGADQGWGGSSASTGDTVSNYDSGTTTTFGSDDPFAFNGAGGQAANEWDDSSSGDLGDLGGTSGSSPNLFGGLGAASGLVSGLSKGGVTGSLGAAANAGKLYNSLTGSTGGAAGLLGTVGSALSAYNGLTSGNPIGEAQGVIGAAGTVGAAGSALGGGAAFGALSSAAGLAGIALLPAAFGASRPAVQLGTAYNERLLSNLNSTDPGTKSSADLELSSLLSEGMANSDLQNYAQQNNIQPLGSMFAPGVPVTPGGLHTMTEKN